MKQNKRNKRLKKSTKRRNIGGKLSFRQHVLQPVLKDLTEIVKDEKVVGSGVNDSKNLRQISAKSLKLARAALRKAGVQKKIRVPRIIPFERTKIGGFLPLIPLFAGLSALRTIAGGASAVANAVLNSMNARKNWRRIDVTMMQWNKSVKKALGCI